MSPSLVFPDSDTDFTLDMDASAPNRINKFDGTNFHTWKFKMQMVLEERDLWEVVSEEIKMEQCVTQLDQATFKRKSRKALAIICLAMEDSQLPLVRSASGAQDAWSRLKEHFEKWSVPNKLFLRRRFFTAKMEKGDDVMGHVHKIKTLAEQLDARTTCDYALHTSQQVVRIPHHGVKVKSRLAVVGGRLISAAARRSQAQGTRR